MILREAAPHAGLLPSSSLDSGFMLSEGRDTASRAGDDQPGSIGRGRMDEMLETRLAAYIQARLPEAGDVRVSGLNRVAGAHLGRHSVSGSIIS